jgi:hypothetical protein
MGAGIEDVSPNAPFNDEDLYLDDDFVRDIETPGQTTVHEFFSSPEQKAVTL